MSEPINPVHHMMLNEPAPSAPPRIFQPEDLEARVELIKKVRETWKGQPGYVETLDMEIWALSLVADVLRRLIDDDPEGSSQDYAGALGAWLVKRVNMS